MESVETINARALRCACRVLTKLGVTDSDVAALLSAPRNLFSVDVATVIEVVRTLPMPLMRDWATESAEINVLFTLLESDCITEITEVRGFVRARAMPVDTRSVVVGPLSALRNLFKLVVTTVTVEETTFPTDFARFWVTDNTELGPLAAPKTLFRAVVATETSELSTLPIVRERDWTIEIAEDKVLRTALMRLRTTDRDSASLLTAASMVFSVVVATPTAELTNLPTVLKSESVAVILEAVSLLTALETEVTAEIAEDAGFVESLARL
jgi:hypothetical protein